MDYNKNSPKAKESLDVNTILKLGLKREEFQDFSKPKPSMPEDYIKINPEMVVAKVKENAIFLNLENVPRFPAKKGEYYLLRMVNFIQLYDKERVEPTPFFKKYYKPYTGEDLNNKSLFVYVYGAGIGDMLFQQAILRNFKIKYPRVFITFAVPINHMEFVKSWNTVDRVVPNITKVNHFLNADYHLNFEFVIRSKKGFEDNVYWNFSKRASIKNFGKCEAYPQIPVNPEYKRYWINILEKKKIKDNFIILNFNSGNLMRIPRFQTQLNILNKLLEKTNYNIVFIDEPKQYQEINKLIKHCSNSKQCYNFCKKSENIISSISLTSLSNLVISVDTGLAHIAAAVGIPLYGIYGPFHGAIRVSTYPNTKWIDSDLDCAPCLEHDLAECKNSYKGHPICYDKYDTDFIVKEALSLIKKGITDDREKI